MASPKPTLDWIKQVLSDPKELEKGAGQLQESRREPWPAGHAQRADLTHSVHPVVESYSLAWELDA